MLCNKNPQNYKTCVTCFGVRTLEGNCRQVQFMEGRLKSSKRINTKVLCLIPTLSLIETLNQSSNNASRERPY